MKHIDTLKKQTDTVSKLYNIIDRSKNAGKVMAVAHSSKKMQNILLSKFNDIGKIAPVAPTKASNGMSVLKNILLQLMLNMVQILKIVI